jgi:xylulose-5-phosphate/fructose-6-phosphate phosphoketolase
MAVLPVSSIGLRPAYSDRFDVHDYKEKGNINSPMELAVNNEIDPFSLTIDAIARIPDCRNSRAHAKGEVRNKQIACPAYACKGGIDSSELGWSWPHRSEYSNSNCGEE